MAETMFKLLRFHDLLAPDLLYLSIYPASRQESYKVIHSRHQAWRKRRPSSRVDTKMDAG